MLKAWNAVSCMGEPLRIIGLTTTCLNGIQFSLLSSYVGEDERNHPGVAWKRAWSVAVVLETIKVWFQSMRTENIPLKQLLRLANAARMQKLPRKSRWENDVLKKYMTVYTNRIVEEKLTQICDSRPTCVRSQQPPKRFSIWSEDERPREQFMKVTWRLNKRVASICAS